MGKDKKRREGPGDKTLPAGKTEGKDTGGHDDCRCKEVAGKTPAELLRLAASDLAFWKKKKPLA